MQNKTLVPIIIILIAAIVSVFSGINQLLGIFSNVSIAGALISAAAALVLFFYVPYAIRKKQDEIEIPKRLSRIAMLTAVLVFCAGTLPFVVQYIRVKNYDRKGQDANVSGASAEAQHYWTKAAHLYKTLGFTDQAIRSKLLLAQAYYQTGRTKEAEEILTEFEKSTELTLENQAKLYAVYGNMYESSGNIVQAEISYQKALQTAKEEDDTRATILMNKAVVVGGKGPLYAEEASDLVKQAQAIFVKLDDYSGVAQTYANLSAQNEFNPGISLAYLDSAEMAAVKVNSPKLKGTIKMNKGLLYKKSGDTDKAVKYYNDARKDFETIGDVLGQAEIQIKLAFVDVIKSDFGSAMQKVKNSLALVNEATKEKHQLNYILLARLYSLQADIMESCGDYKEAENLFHKSLDILKEHRNYGTELHSKINYAAFLQRRNRITDAMPLLRELESLVFSDFANKATQTSLVVINNIGKTYQDAGQLDKAKEFYTKAMDMAVEIGDKYFEANAAENIAIVLRWQQSDQWETYLQRALTIYKQLSNNSAELQCLFNFYNMSSNPGMLWQILDLVDQPSIDEQTQTNVTLGIFVNDIRDDRRVNQHLLRLEKLRKKLESDGNIMLTGKVHMRIAEVEQYLGNINNIEPHFEPIEKSLHLFPFPQNISMQSGLALLKIATGKYAAAVVNLFAAFDLATGQEKQQEVLLRMIKFNWSFVGNNDKKSYIAKLHAQYENSQSEYFRKFVEEFLRYAEG